MVPRLEVNSKWRRDTLYRPREPGSPGTRNHRAATTPAVASTAKGTKTLVPQDRGVLQRRRGEREGEGGRGKERERGRTREGEGRRGKEGGRGEGKRGEGERAK